MLSATLVCQSCGWRTTCGEDEIARRLRTLGLLRRSPHPPTELVGELLRVNAHRLACDACLKAGLAIIAHGDGGPLRSPTLGDDDAGDWQQAAICEICREEIPPERLEVFPNAKLCAKCQNLSDQNKSPAPPEFCPKCGALLEMRVNRGGGITRYKQFCTGEPPCRL